MTTHDLDPCVHPLVGVLITARRNGRWHVLTYPTFHRPYGREPQTVHLVDRTSAESAAADLVRAQRFQLAGLLPVLTAQVPYNCANGLTEHLCMVYRASLGDDLGEWLWRPNGMWHNDTALALLGHRTVLVAQGHGGEPGLSPTWALLLSDDRLPDRVLRLAPDQRLAVAELADGRYQPDLQEVTS